VSAKLLLRRRAGEWLLAGSVQANAEIMRLGTGFQKGSVVPDVLQDGVSLFWRNACHLAHLLNGFWVHIFFASV